MFFYNQVLFATLGQPRYNGASKIIDLSPALVEKLIKKATTSSKKKVPHSWLVIFYANWSDSCVEHEPMLADLSLSFTSKTLQFGRVDVVKWPDLAVEHRINVSMSSWQLPTLILFQHGKEVGRLPSIDGNNKVTKTVLDRARLLMAFQLQDLKDGKRTSFAQ
ncbi:hypothetical protein CCR75_001747 [Bremia lactucae]|uniref:Thioredoxin domain-containing protein n=1 Tax=Bremia lactucae TaxID=4779 RepID=A0A976FR61_BRELC|nr:hypothetical protein CCR75_001747 [Bremia lactucae]